MNFSVSVICAGGAKYSNKARWRAIFLMTIFLISLFELRAFSPACEFGSPPKILLEDGEASSVGSKILQRWDVANQDLFADLVSPRHNLSEFRRLVKEATSDVSQNVLLRNAIAEGSLSTYDRRNAERVLAHEGRLIRPMKCLESLLLDIQIGRLDMLTKPSEFIAFVLRSSEKDFLRIYSYTTNEAGVRNLGTLLEYIQRDVENGWKVWINIHNHNFFFNANGPLRGTVAPSGADISFFRSIRNDLGVKEAWITNGFDTVILPEQEFEVFFSSDQP